MNNDFMNKLDDAYKKGFSSNPQFIKAAEAIGEFAKGENGILLNENMRGKIETSREVGTQRKLEKEPEEMEI